jgi:hypothetical protein
MKKIKVVEKYKFANSVLFIFVNDLFKAAMVLARKGPKFP